MHQLFILGLYQHTELSVNQAQVFLFPLFHLITGNSCEVCHRMNPHSSGLSSSIYNCFCLANKLCPILWEPRTVACQTPLSIGFAKQEYWSGGVHCHFLLLGIFLIQESNLHWQMDFLPLESLGKPENSTNCFHFPVDSIFLFVILAEKELVGQFHGLSL